MLDKTVKKRISKVTSQQHNLHSAITGKLKKYTYVDLIDEIKRMWQTTVAYMYTV
jgi:hypothetical protein